MATCDWNPQLYRLLNRLKFQDISLPEDFDTAHEIVGSYALQAGLAVDERILTTDFYHRLVTAGAFRWGLIIKLTIWAIGEARVREENVLRANHYIDA